jgi:hypothetical protein
MLLVAGEAKVGTGSIAHPTESTVKRLKSNEGEREKKKYWVQVQPSRFGGIRSAQN